jgi:superfamily I DNA/RNA helicase
MKENGVVDETKINEHTVSNANMDLFETVELLLNNYNKNNKGLNIKSFIEYIETMLNTKNPKNAILCTSIHQAKGLETNNVFVLNEARPFYELARTKDQVQQERNLSYIALTRAKENLYLVKESEKIDIEEME